MPPGESAPRRHACRGSTAGYIRDAMDAAENEFLPVLRQVFTTDQAAVEWLDTPDRSLAGKTPRAVAATGDHGAAKVRELINRMVHGIPT